MFSFSVFSALALAACHTTTASPLSAASSLPIVDLGYVKQQASSFNQAGKFYEFNNIAFGQPPTGNLRWAAPQPPLAQKGIQDGNKISPRCNQASPKWLSHATTQPTYQTKDPAESEDCLYLDVWVPKKVFDRRNDPSYSAPVLVEIFGGGFVLGYKDLNNATGLVTRGTSGPDSDGVIYVELNYRLGYFGWLGGPDYHSEGGVANLGFLDQQLALQWVQNNIHKFGGDASRMTLMGESGGALSVATQLTSEFSKSCSKPYKQAIIQSPPRVVLPSNDSLNSIYHDFLRALNVSTLAEARKLPAATLYNANSERIYNFEEGVFKVGPSYDGVHVKKTATQELLAGNYPAGLKAITSYNFAEGYIFEPTHLPGFPDNFTALVEHALPNAPPKTLARLTNDLYPPAGPGTTYNDAAGRAELFVGDEGINCDAFAYEHVFGDNTFAYKFSVTDGNVTGIHTQDLAYTFYHGSAQNESRVAKTMQGWFMDFARYGDPNHSGASTPPIPIYSRYQQLLNISETHYGIITDRDAAPRCQFWNTEAAKYQ